MRSNTVHFNTMRAVIYSVIILLGLGSALPNVLPQSISEQLPDWYSSNTMILGLDLQGGSHLLMAMDTDELFTAKNQHLANELTAELRRGGIRFYDPVVDQNGITVQPRQTKHLNDATRVARALISQQLGGQRYDIVQTADKGVELTVTDIFQQSLTKDAIERSLEVIRNRLNETGMVEPTITQQGKDSILIQLPGVADPQYIRQLLGTTAKMTFHWVVENVSAGKKTMELRGQLPSQRFQLEQEVAFEGKYVSDATLGFGQESNESLVNFKLDNTGAKKFAELTKNNIGRPLAIVLDNKVITAPVIRSAITGGRGEISGNFTASEAKDLALLLRAGALPTSLNVIEERTVGPDLGSDAIDMGVMTGLVGAGLVLAFMLGIYGRWGFIACFALSVNIGLIFGILSLFGATLTLPGIAGLILSIGMAVDSNILINERIREETRNDKKARSALEAGFKRAFSTILDSNVTTLIAISLLFLFGEGPIKGFAVTMGVGLLASLFTAISLTRLLMQWYVNRLTSDKLEISGLTWLTSILTRSAWDDGKAVNFLKARFFGIALSAVLSIVSLIFIVKPGLNYGIDFNGGSLVEVQSSQTSISDLRTGLKNAGFDNVAIQEFGDDSRYLIRLPAPTDAAVASGESITHLKESINEISDSAQFPRTEMVGPKVSGDFSDTSILAIILAGTGMLGYLWLRFETHFAIAAIATIALDLTKTLGFFALTGIEFNLTAIAALLALIGYSINDKVVVFDRIRENLKSGMDKPLIDILNKSITSTITRTIFTSVTTFLAIIPMAIYGGHAVASFASPMLFGIVIGTSSSILIASPILLFLGQKRLERGLSQLSSESEEDKRMAAMP
jgi:SecD/SecF fusion protein